MRIAADENISARLVAIIRDNLLDASHNLESAADRNARGQDDEIWVAAFGREGGDAVVSGDVKITRRPHEILAIAQAKLKLVVLDGRWSQAKNHEKIAYLCYWWPHIEAALSGMRGFKPVKVPWGWPQNTHGAIKPLALDLQAMEKKRKKQLNR